MNNAAKLFADYLNQRNIKYSIFDEDTVRVNYGGENCASINVNFIFSDDGRDVAVRSYSIAKVPKEAKKEYFGALLACSELNRIFRWVKFYLDDDNEFTAEDDAIIDPYTTGEECYKLLRHMVNVIDKAYPTIMKAVWGLT